MVSFIATLLRLSRPYKRRLILGVVMGLLGGLLEPLLMLSVKVVVDVVFPGASTVNGFTVNSIRDMPVFTDRLKAQSDSVSQYLWSRFSPTTRQRLADYTDTNSPPPGLDQALTSELNLIILDPLYNEQRFANIKLTKEAQGLLASPPGTVSVSRLNRALLESTYPTELSPTKLQLLDKYPTLREHLSWLARWVPDTSSSTRRVNVMLVILIIPLMMFLRGLVSYLNVYYLQWVAIRTIADLRSRLFNHLLNMPLAFLNKVSTGELLSRVSSDTTAVAQAISSSLVTIIKDPATVIGLIILLLTQQPILTLLSMIIFPVCLVPIIIYSRKVRHSSRAIQTQYATLNKIMHESFTGNRIIKAYNLEENATQQFQQATGTFISHYMRTVRAGELPGPMIEFFGAVGIACLFYYILLVAHKPPDAGEFLMFVVSIFSLYRPIKSISRLYTQMEQANAASARVFQLLATTTTLPEPKNPIPLKAAGADIQFDHIDFNYGEKPILRDFSLTIKAGQMVALVGPTGSGKTTVTNLLLRFYDPQNGAVRIGGIDIRDVGTANLRSQIAVVTQETLLFDDTIRRNIELGRPGASDAEIEAAAKHAHAHEFIIEKEGAYAAKIGEKGVMLSGGQKQRMAIARAILKNAPILVLDEATSALDTQMEREVQAALEELMQGRTTICIAHRLSTIQKADLIVVLDQGRIVETGRHEELLRHDGIYRRLHELQFQP